MVQKIVVAAHSGCGHCNSFKQNLANENIENQSKFDVIDCDDSENKNNEYCNASRGFPTMFQHGNTESCNVGNGSIASIINACSN